MHLPHYYICSYCAYMHNTFEHVWAPLHPFSLLELPNRHGVGGGGVNELKWTKLTQINR